MSDETFNKRYLVILADRQKAKFFTIYLNSFEDQGEEMVKEDVPQKVRAEHTRPSKVQQHIQEHLHQHLKRVGQKAWDFLIQRGVKQLDGVVIGGHKELLSRVKETLPSKLKNKVVLEFVTNLGVPIGDLTGKVIIALKEQSKSKARVRDEEMFFDRRQIR